MFVKENPDRKKKKILKTLKEWAPKAKNEDYMTWFSDHLNYHGISKNDHLSKNTVFMAKFHYDKEVSIFLSALYYDK